jgi:type II secretory pathway predicted ATPase ExeA
MLTPRRHPSSRPFMAAPRTQFYHPAADIDAGLQAVERSIRRAEGVALVVGAAGTGKSLLLALVAEHVRDDFDVAFLSGARICTRRALWQSILAEIGEPYRGIDEVELRMAVVERIRGLAATGSGLVVLVDEAQTLPTRLIEELRLLTNVPTPLPAVHIVLAGSPRLEEMLGQPRMESMAQRVAVRAYLEPLDHAETMVYLRAQMKTAGLDWDSACEPGCDDVVFTATDGVPRLVNQLCDHALLRAADAGRRVTPADIAASWREIQRLPAPALLERSAEGLPGNTITRLHHGERPLPRAHADDALSDLEGAEVIEFGSPMAACDEDRGVFESEPFAGETEPRTAGTESAGGSPAAADLWRGPEVELVFDSSADPFEELFAEEERVVERYVMRGPDDFADCPAVASREGQAISRLLDSFEPRGGAVTTSDPSRESVARVTAGAEHAGRPRNDSGPVPPVASGAAAVEVCDETAQSADEAGELDDDADMVVIEDDLAEANDSGRASVFAVRLGDYRSLFTRLRRGDGRR